MIATFSGTRAAAWSKKNPRLRRRFTLSMAIITSARQSRPQRSSPVNVSLGSSSRACQARARTCDEKDTHAANVRAEANLQLAGRRESVTLPAPNHGRFLLHLKAP